MNTSIKNNVAISITYVHSVNNSLKKTLYYAIDIISSEVVLFALRCGIDQTIQISSSFYIIIIMDTIYVAQIFLILLHICTNSSWLQYQNILELSSTMIGIIL